MRDLPFKRGVYLVVLLLCYSAGLRSQDTSVFPLITINSSQLHRAINLDGTPPVTFKFPSEIDKENLKKYGYLVDQEPSLQNYPIYSQLAQSLWELNMIDSAERMLQAILQSNELFYTNQYSSSSDIPGDTTSNVYGYGSVVWNYKHKAAKCLSKIYIERKLYDSAQYFLDLAKGEYKEQYNCGTGHRFYQNSLDEIQLTIYEGKSAHQKIIDTLLPNSFENNGYALSQAIKKVYPRWEIDSLLKVAANSMIFTPDDEMSIYYTSTIKNGTEVNDTTRYFGAEAKISFFGLQLSLYPDLQEEGVRVNREMMLAKFRNSEVVYYLRKP